jgi:hypothetical protein
MSEGVAQDPHAFWMTTSTGLHFYPKDPEHSSYRIEDIAHSLSQMCRFGGQCCSFYSVAEHSLLVSEVVARADPTLALWGLLHDAAEAYVLDLPRPIKYLPEMAPYRELEDRVQRAILSTFQLPLEKPQLVKEADRLVLRVEAEALGLLSKDWDVYDWPDCGVRPVPMSPRESESAFYRRFLEITSR